MRRFYREYLLKGLVLLGLTLPAQYSFAQKNGPPNELDKNFVPDKNSVFNTKSPGGREYVRSGEIHNIIEFHPGYLVRNIFALQYERRLNDILGVQGGLGVCYGKDYFQMVMSPEGDFFGSSTVSSVKLNDILSKGNTLNPNAFLNFALRVYTSGYYYGNYDGQGYIELGFRTYKNTIAFDASSIAGNGGIMVGGPEVVKNMIYYINYGYHLESDGKIPTTHNFYFGFGLRRTSYSGFTSNQTSGSYTTTVNTMNSSIQNVIYPIVQVGYELGFGFK